MAVEAIQSHRKQHLAISKLHNLPLAYEAIADELLKHTSTRTGIPLPPPPKTYTFTATGPTVCKIDKTGYPTIEEIKAANVKTAQPIMVVMPPCHKDVKLAIDNLKWQKELDGKKDFHCVFAVDDSLANSVSWLTTFGKATFQEVSVFTYPRPPVSKWPDAPNWAFQHTARHMRSFNHPWFWMEPDCIPIAKGWLSLLNQEYALCRKPIMGSIIDGMGHCNGTAIYPSNFCELSRAAMACTNRGWDMEMKSETIHLTHPSKLMYHIWGIANGVAVQNGGNPVLFRTWDDVQRWVDLDCVVVHRCKNTSLIERLRGRV